MSDRWIDLEGLVNVRCLGGLPTVDGRTTRPGVLLRGDDPIAATAADVETLVQRRNVALVVDLRSDEEHEAIPHCPVTAAGARRVRVPVVDRTLMAKTFTADASLRGDAAVRWMGEAYLAMNEIAVDHLRTILAALATTGGDGAAYVHCAAGKDRTGVVVAHLLALAGVDRATIVADYAMTDARMARVVAAMRRRAGNPLDEAPRPPVLQQAPAGAMEVFLDGFTARHGDTASWLLAAGTPADHIDAWRERFVY